MLSPVLAAGEDRVSHVLSHVVWWKYSQIHNTIASTNANTIQANSVAHIRTVLFTSGFGSSTRGERHNSFHADHTLSRCLRSLSVEIRKTQLHLQYSKFNSQLPTQWQEPNFLPAWSNVNLQLTLFQNPQILSPSLLGMTSATLQPHFSCLGFNFCARA